MDEKLKQYLEEHPNCVEDGVLPIMVGGEIREAKISITDRGLFSSREAAIKAAHKIIEEERNA